MTAPKTSDGAKPAVPFVAISGCCDRAQREKPGSSERSWCWQSYLRASLGGRETSAHQLALDVVRDQLLGETARSCRGRWLSSHRAQRRGEKQVKRGERKRERRRVQAGGGWQESRASVSVLLDLDDCSGQNHGVGLALWRSGMGGFPSWTWRGNSCAGCLRVFPFPGSQLYDAMYPVCLPHQYEKLCTWQYLVYQ